MDNQNEVAKAEAQLDAALVDLKAAEELEKAAEHKVEEAVHELEELREHEILLDIATPKGLFKGIFPDETTVAAVIEVVVQKKNLDRKDTFELVYKGKVLQPVTHTLKSFSLGRKAELELVATGSGA